MTSDEKASITVRKYIKRGDGPPLEPTSTLVMTSPLKHYVDTRILMPEDATMPISSITQIEWAFAGTSRTTAATADKPEHHTWMHWVDSTTPDAESVQDEGDMITLENGDMVERGESVNPKTGEMETYEESWADIKPSGERLGWVIKAQGQGTRGMLIRIGGFAQGILRRGGEVGIKRWRYIGGDQGWESIVAIGSCDVPPEVFGDKSNSMEEGEQFLDTDGLKWVCIEKFKGQW